MSTSLQFASIPFASAFSYLMKGVCLPHVQFAASGGSVDYAVKVVVSTLGLGATLRTL
jgi:hypothetical protein